jgi:hypothetical protein
MTCLAFLSITQASAESLVGSNYAGGRFTALTLGNDAADEAIGGVWVFDVFGSTPLSEEVDTILGAGHGFGGDKIGGVPIDYSTTFVTTEFRYQFMKDEAINPYVIGGPFIKRWEIDVDNGAAPAIAALNGSKDLAGVALGGGAEFELGSKFLARTELNLRLDTNVDVTTVASGSVGWWVFPQLLGSLGLGWDSEDEDIGLQFIATWKLD